VFRLLCEDASALHHHVSAPKHKIMMPTRFWEIFCWNVRGINSDKKWNSVRDKITERNCDIICLQETKKALIDQAFLRKICPQGFDSFTFKPSNGASGEILVAWKGALFSSLQIFQNDFAILVEMTSTINNNS
jgi:hypothetical protein